MISIEMMPVEYHRRSVLQIVAAIGCGLMSGCQAFSGYDPGTVTIQNEYTLPQDITFSVTNGIEKTITVKSGEKAVIEDFLTEPGTYDINVNIHSGPQDKIADYTLKRANGGINGGSIHITITKSYKLHWTISYDNPPI